MDGWGKNVQTLQSFSSNPTQSHISRAAGALGALQNLEQAYVRRRKASQKEWNCYMTKITS